MTTLIDAPARVDGVQLIGEMAGSGYRTPPSLVRRADGQVLQLSPLLYLVMTAIDGRRSHADIADAVGRASDRRVTEADVRALVDRHLRPLGLIAAPDGSAPELKRADPLLGLKPRVAVTSPSATRRLTDPFRFLFRPVVAVPVLAAFLAVVVWVFFERGLGASAYEAFERPHLLVLVFLVTVISGGVHEFGHAAATRYSGGVPGAMGAGLYLVWPAFYTDVTDSYRLDRAGRIRTDLGGLYFNAVIVVVTFLWWWATGWEALLLLVATQILQMVTQLLPLLRFDGYHVLADLAGVPDLYHRIRPTLRGLLPKHWHDPEQRMLTPRARALITAWVLVTVPLMAFMLYSMVRAVPRLLGTAGAALGEDATAVADAVAAGAFLDAAGHSLELLGVALPVLACMLVLGRIGFRFFRSLVGWSRGSARKRVAAAAVGAVVVGALAWAWWPAPDTYRPIDPGERGTIHAVLGPGASQRDQADAVAPGAGASPVSTPIGASAERALADARSLVAVFEQGAALPAKEAPALAMILVPTTAAGDEGGASSDDIWVFPFDKPLPPEAGDNQALAVVTEDGSVAYDVAFALVWAEGTQVLNVNEAHAYASCSDCAAVAVAFQVVFIMDDARVVVPQNLAVAANYDCYECITAAIANQLVLSVAGEPGEEQLRALGEVWNELVLFGEDIASRSLSEIVTRFDEFTAAIIQIMAEAPSLDPAAPTETTAPSPATSPGPLPSTTAPDPVATTPPDTAVPQPQPDEPQTTTEPEPPASPTPEPTPAETTPSPSP